MLKGRRKQKKRFLSPRRNCTSGSIYTQTRETIITLSMERLKKKKKP